MNAKEAQKLTKQVEIQAKKDQQKQLLAAALSKAATAKWFKEKYLPKEKVKFYDEITTAIKEGKKSYINCKSRVDSEFEYLVNELKTDGYTVETSICRYDGYYDRDYGCEVGGDVIYTITVSW